MKERLPVKRIFALILALCMTFSLFACGKKVPFLILLRF